MTIKGKNKHSVTENEASFSLSALEFQLEEKKGPTELSVRISAQGSNIDRLPTKDPDKKRVPSSTRMPVEGSLEHDLKKILQL